MSIRLSICMYLSVYLYVSLCRSLCFNVRTSVVLPVSISFCLRVCLPLPASIIAFDTRTIRSFPLSFDHLNRWVWPNGREADVETDHRSSVNTVNRSLSKNWTPFLFLFRGRPRIVSSGAAKRWLEAEGSWTAGQHVLSASLLRNENRFKFIIVTIMDSLLFFPLFFLLLLLWFTFQAN